MAPHSSTPAWKIPWMEERGGLQSMGLLRVGHDSETSLSLFTFMHWRRKWQPTPVFLPGESQGRGAWWAAVYGVSQSRTRLKQLSSSSSSIKNIGMLSNWEWWLAGQSQEQSRNLKNVCWVKWTLSSELTFFSGYKKNLRFREAKCLALGQET